MLTRNPSCRGPYGTSSTGAVQVQGIALLMYVVAPRKLDPIVSVNGILYPKEQEHV